MMAMLAETFVFLYMGMAMFSIEQVADSVAPAAAARSEPCPQSTDCIIRVPHLAHNTGIALASSAANGSPFRTRPAD